MSAVSAVSQVAAAAAAGEAEGSQALSSLAQEAFSNSSATATAVHNCVYRPYIARQVGSVLHCRSLLHSTPQLAVKTQLKCALRFNESWEAGEVPSHVRVTLCYASPLNMKRHMQAAEAAELARGEELLLPPNLDYSALQLSAEDREKLGAARCESTP